MSSSMLWLKLACHWLCQCLLFRCFRESADAQWARLRAGRHWQSQWHTLGVAALLVGCLLPASVQSEVVSVGFTAAPTWSTPNPAKVRSEAFDWLSRQAIDPAVRAQAEAQWPQEDDQLAGVFLLERLVTTVALAHEQGRELVALCEQSKAPLVLPAFDWLADDRMPPLVRNNLRLWYGRWLSQQRLYDESLEALAGLEPADVVDPASLLFYQSVANHWLLDTEHGLRALDRLLEKRGQLPKRYESLAAIMRADLAALEDESLDHISRRMDDITRRLELGRVNKKVAEVEDGVIASLDKLIKQLEDQQDQQQASSSARMRPGTPAQDSRPLGGKGPGEVVKKRIDQQGGWGDLPPKEREEALQSIGKDFPSHYREVIEQYFRRLASEENEER